MTIMTKRQKAQQVRRDYLKQRVRSNPGGMAVKDPIVVDKLNDDGLMPIAVLEVDIKIEIENWQGQGESGEADRLILEWRTDSAAQFKTVWEDTFRYPSTAPEFIQASIPLEFFKNLSGLHHVRYTLHLWYGDSSESTEMPVLIDRIPPWGLSIPPEVEHVDRVLQTDLDDNGGVWVTIPAPIPLETKAVRVQVAWLDSPPSADERDSIPNPDLDETLPLDRKLLIPKSRIEELKSGKRYVVYQLFDLAGNRSRLSQFAIVEVVLGALPDDMQPPYVPLAEDDVIDVDDAVLGVKVMVPRYTNAFVDDKILVSWGSDQLSEVSVGEGAGDISIEVSRERLKAEYGTATGAMETDVSYFVRRGSHDFDSRGIKVLVNFDYPGPNPTDPLDPVNDQLPNVTVMSYTGQENAIVVGDFGEEASLNVTLYTPTAVNELLTFYWGGVALDDSHTCTGSDGGDEISVTATWDEIQAVGSGTVPVSYTVSHPDHVNQQKSTDTQVTVADMPIVLEPTDYPDARTTNGGNPILNCSSLRKDRDGNVGYRIRVPASIYLVEEAIITMKWHIVVGEGIEVIAEKEEELIIPAGADTAGMEWFLMPYEDHILPVSAWGYAYTSYTLTINNAEQSALATRIRISVTDLEAENGSCSLADITPLP